MYVVNGVWPQFHTTLPGNLSHDFAEELCSKIPNIITQDEFNADYNDIYQTAYMQAKSGGKTDKEAEKAAKSEADEYKKFLNKNNYVVDNTSSRYKTVGDLQREERQAMEAVKKRKEGSK